MAADGGHVALLPSSNRGVSEFRKEPDSIRVGFDWISFSVDLAAVAREQGAEFDGATLSAIATDPEVAGVYAAHLFAFFFGGSGLELGEVKGAGRWYSFRAQIVNPAGDFVGMVELGGERAQRKDGTPTARLELTGDGCRAFDSARSGHAKRWLMLQAKLESTGGRITRADVAADDVEGKFPIAWAIAAHQEGKFKQRGQQPKAKLINDFDSGDGKTLYIGTGASEHMLRAYEKGREQGDPNSEWMRYEGQFRASSRREIPLAILRDPGAFLLGVYPVLACIVDALAERMEITKAAAAASWTRARRSLKRMFGNTLSFVFANTNNDHAAARVLKQLTGEKLPPWAKRTAGIPGIDWPDIVSANDYAPGGAFACT